MVTDLEEFVGSERGDDFCLVTVCLHKLGGEPERVGIGRWLWWPVVHGGALTGPARKPATPGARRACQRRDIAQ